MKKSQVLAAIALAFALGLAPIASTFAVTSIKETCTDAKAEALELILDFGDQTSSAGIVALKTAMDDLNNAYKPSAKALRDAFAAYKASSGATQPSGVEKAVWYVAQTAIDQKATINGKVLTVDDFLGKNYDQVVALADSATYTTYTQEAFDTMVEAADGMLANYVGPVTAALATLGMDENLPTELTAGAVLAYVNGLPNYTKTATLLDVYNKNAAVCDGTDDETLTKGADTFKAAIAAYNAPAETPVTPDEPADEEKPTTPDTGVNTASEASATASVSILSGLASVATAAGVVIRKAFRK